MKIEKRLLGSSVNWLDLLNNSRSFHLKITEILLICVLLVPQEYLKKD